MSSRSLLRRQCRQARAALDGLTRRAASNAICKRLHAAPVYWRARHLAFYWPNGPEVDLLDLLAVALREHKRCYLPVMRPGGHLSFVRYRGDAGALRRNRFGIPEPRYRSRDLLAAPFLDLVFVPLAGFDRAGTRLGLGGGFYDRSFAFLRRPGPRKPRLVGVAFACQEVARIPREPWDVTLVAVATERELIDCAQPRNSP